MSFPAASDHESYEHRVPPASRLIPGSSFSGPTVQRKKPRSVTWDERYWVDDEADLSGPPQQDLTAEMCRALLPTPAHGGGRWRVLTEAATDFLLAALNLAVLFSLPALRPGPGSIPSLPQMGVVLVYGALLTLIGHSEGLYHGDTDYQTEAVILGKVVAWATLLMVGPLCASGSLKVSTMAVSAPMTYFILLAWRTWQRHQETGTSDPTVRKVLIVGAGESARDLATQLSHERSHRRVVCGFLDDEHPAEENVLGGLGDLVRIARAEFVDEIIVADSTRREVVRRVIREARKNRLDVKIVPDFFGLAPRPVALERFGDTPVLTLHEEPIPAIGLFAKRVLDIVLSSIALLIAAPVLAAIAAVIKLDSRGPALYRATRVGRKGRHFYCYKFRTMTVNADKLKEQLRTQNEREGAFFKITDDPRITKTGRFLRRYSLDELPQLLNVIKGDMSLVGPRPHPVDDCERYRLQDLRRLDVMPGITGLWQVTARRDPSFENNMALDLEYIESWNLWMDLKILYRTIRVVTSGSGA